jgi:hypothetical protein
MLANLAVGAVSKRISDLEEAVGSCLLERHSSCNSMASSERGPPWTTSLPRLPGKACVSSRWDS